jgi:adenosine deaminase
MHINTHLAGSRPVRRFGEKIPAGSPGETPPIVLADGYSPSPDESAVVLSRKDFSDAVRLMPKIQLHDHLEGAVRPGTILEEADRLGLPRPATDVGAMQAMIAMRPNESLLDFLKKFDPFRFIFEDKDSLKRIAYEAVEDNARDGVKYVELRMNCLKNEKKMSIGEVMDAVLAGMRKGSAELGVESRFIASINRSYPVETAMKIVKEAVARKDQGVVGIDLAGDEVHHPPEKFKEVFAYAHAHGLQITVHAGEAVGPKSIEGAIDTLGAERIGHGVRLREDQATLRKVRDEHVHLEMCPHSNHLLNIVQNMAEFPLREYTEQGISCSLNTDDPHIFGVTLVQEYVGQAQNSKFTLQELQALNLDAIRAAFLPMVDKERLIAEFQKDYDRLNDGLIQGKAQARAA